MNSNQQIIEEFYAGLAAQNAETMISCYHPEIRFEDPIFGILEGQDAADMWRMIVERSDNTNEILFSDVIADQNEGSAKWIATYQFGKSQRRVVNEVTSSFKFKDGLIVEQKDTFDVWKWSKQALGLAGLIFGWTSVARNKIRKNAIQNLRKFQNKK